MTVLRVDVTWHRPCLVLDPYGDTTPAFVHMSLSNTTTAKVEFDTGKLASIPWERVRLVDSAEMFDEYTWEG